MLSFKKNCMDDPNPRAHFDLRMKVGGLYYIKVSPFLMAQIDHVTSPYIILLSFFIMFLVGRKTRQELILFCITTSSQQGINIVPY